MTMRKLSMLYFLLPLAGITSVSGQQSEIYTHKLSEYDNALLLYKDKQYQAAQILFDRVKQSNNDQEVQADCAYYIANCAIHLNQSNADELMEDFVADYPTSTKQNQAYIEVAQYYFEQGKFPQALEYFDKVDESSMSNLEIEKYNFQKGYSFFSAKRKKEYPFRNRKVQLSKRVFFF